MNIRDYYNSVIFSDFKIISNEGTVIHAHRLILNKIPYFQTYFKDISSGELRVNYSYRVIELVLQTLYDLHPKYNSDLVFDVYRLSKDWNYKSLTFSVLFSLRVSFYDLLENDINTIESFYQIFKEEKILKEEIWRWSVELPIDVPPTYLEVIRDILTHKRDQLPESFINYDCFKNMETEFQYRVLFRLKSWERLKEINPPKREVLTELLRDSHFSPEERSMILKTEKKWIIKNYSPLEMEKNINWEKLLKKEKTI